MRKVNPKFYHSKQWKTVRALYIEKNPFCEMCLKQGRIERAEHVHHITHLNGDNVNNPAIAFGESNLMALCIECHNKIHYRQDTRRYKVDKNGDISPLV